MSCLLEISVIVIQCELWTDNNDMTDSQKQITYEYTVDTNNSLGKVAEKMNYAEK